MEQSEADKPTWRPTNPHDRFCRRTAFHPQYAPDFLKSYGDPLLVKYVDLDNLQAAPTTHLSDALKEVIMDASLTTRLLDTQSLSEVLLHLEHKSRPSRTVAVQLLAEVGLSLHFRWFLNKKLESENFVPPIPLMIVVYNGNEDWEGEVWFQDLFPDLPKELRSFVPQFRIFVINLRRFHYGNLPGRPETQAIAESLKRATDGTFVEHLRDVFQHVADADLDERRTLDLSRTIASYGMLSARVTPEQIIEAISTVFERKEYLKMEEVYWNSFIQKGIELGEAQGIEIGEARGELKGRIQTILTYLRFRFGDVPDRIVAALNRRTDPIALESLVALTDQCDSLEEFADAL